jgi:hypothetical protein
LIAYIPHTEHTVSAIRELATEGLTALDSFQSGLQVFSKDPGDISDIDMASIPFVSRLVVYHEDRLSLQDTASLTSYFSERGLTLVLRGSDYASQQWLIQRASLEA